MKTSRKCKCFSVVQKKNSKISYGINPMICTRQTPRNLMRKKGIVQRTHLSHKLIEKTVINKSDNLLHVIKGSITEVRNISSIFPYFHQQFKQGKLIKIRKELLIIIGQNSVATSLPITCSVLLTSRISTIPYKCLYIYIYIYINKSS